MKTPAKRRYVRFPQVFGIDTGRDKHPLSLIKPDKATQIQEKIKGMSLYFAHKYQCDPEELFQEACLAAASKFEIGDSLGRIVLAARYALLQYVCEQKKASKAKEAARDLLKQHREECKTFDGLDTYLEQLPEYDRKVFTMWLQGDSPSHICRVMKKKNAAVIRKTIEQVATFIANKVGENVRLECLWPTVAKALPIGIEPHLGKFKARVRREGKLWHLGTFSTVEEAVAVREKFLTENTFRTKKELAQIRKAK